MHELGHGIMAFNCASRPHPINEEQLVNDFAVAFWLHYGEKKKINQLKSIVSSALLNFAPPGNTRLSYADWAYQEWGTAEMMSFNNYGWFQMNCVHDSLQRNNSLEIVLAKMGIKSIEVQPKKLLTYATIDDTTPPAIINDATHELRKWGVAFSLIHHAFDNNPNKHMCNMIEL